MPPAYRRAPSSNRYWLPITLAGIAFGAGASFVLFRGRGSSPPPAALAALITGPILCSFLLGWWAMAQQTKRRIASLDSALTELGWLMSPRPGPELKQSFFAPLVPLQAPMRLRGDARNVRWLAVEEGDRPQKALCEYLFTTGSGKTTQQHFSTILAWTEAHPDIPEALARSAPILLEKPRALERGLLKKSPDKVEHDELRAIGWDAFGDPHAVQRLVTPALLEALAHAPRGEQWFVGRGLVACAARCALDHRGIADFLCHAEHTARALRTNFC